MTTGLGDSSKSIFDMTPEEIENRMNRRLDELKKEIFAKGLPLTYQDERCPSEDHFIREYEDGGLHLAVLDRVKQVFVFVKDLSHA